MIALLRDHQETLARLCVRHKVRRLEAFGSAAEDRFDPATSDLDFLVEFLSLEPIEHARAYFGLLEALQDLFHREIDLVEVRAISNPYLLKSVNESRVPIYAA